MGSADLEGDDMEGGGADFIDFYPIAILQGEEV